MQTYQPMPNYYPYQPPQYQDRLNQLQNQYQQSINASQMFSGQIPGTNQQVNQGLLWVSGEIGAKSYLVAPNSTVLLMDSDSSRFYLKSADNAGMPSLRVFEYSEVTNQTQNAPQSPNWDENVLNGKYVTRAEYEGLRSQYESIVERLDKAGSIGAEGEVNSKSKSRGRGGNNNEQSDI